MEKKEINSPNCYVSVGCAIRAYRLFHGLTQEKLGNLLPNGRLCSSSISKIEYNKTDSYYSIIDIAKTFGFSTQQLKTISLKEATFWTKHRGFRKNRFSTWEWIYATSLDNVL